jgi:lipoyl(octanoyl) transferase
MTVIDEQWIGRVSFEEGLRLQEGAAERLKRGEGSEVVLFLEHDPVYTIGRRFDRSSLGESPENLPYPWFETGRGGQSTYHGPGQLVGYPILDLRRYGRDLHAYLRLLEEAVIACCAEFGVNTARREGLTGVWVEDRKIASIGVGVRNWITMHGFALNVGGDLGPFQRIVPCSIAGVRMTSLARELGASLRAKGGPGVEEVAGVCGGCLRRCLAAARGA